MSGRGTCSVTGGRRRRPRRARSLAGRPHDRVLRLAAKAALQRPAVNFDATQIRAVAAGFGDYARRANLAIWACAVMPDHVHLVLGRHRMDMGKLVIQLKGAATRRLAAEGVHPFPKADRQAKCFARGEWKVFLDSDEDVLRSIRYVEQNPEKEGFATQRWEFVTPYV